MKMYTVHLRREGLDPDRDIVLVEEAFSWPAFLFTALWALWHRLWFAAGALFVVGSVAGYGLSAIGIHPALQALASLMISVFTGMFAGDIRRYFLLRDGYADGGVVSGRDSDGAYRRFLDGNPAVVAAP